MYTLFRIETCHDEKATLTNGRLEHFVHSKPTHTDAYLNVQYSHHHFQI